MSNTGIFDTRYVQHIPKGHPFDIKTPKSSAAKKSSAAANDDTQSKYVPGQINIFTGKPLPKISKLSIFQPTSVQAAQILLVSI